MKQVQNILDLKGMIFRKYDGWNGSSFEFVIESVEMSLESVTISGYKPKWGSREPSDKPASYQMPISSFVQMMSYGSFKTFGEIDHCSYRIEFDVY